MPTNMTGLHLAAYFGLLKTMTALLNDKYYLELKDSYGKIPLSWAAKNGHELAVSLLFRIDSVKADSLNKDSRTPIS
jgi:ankyrin repeat protein